jgi:hypothetical protein
MYVPGQTTTVPPTGAAVTAALIDENVALSHESPDAEDVPVGDTKSAPFP